MRRATTQGVAPGNASGGGRGSSLCREERSPSRMRCVKTRSELKAAQRRVAIYGGENTKDVHRETHQDTREHGDRQHAHLHNQPQQHSYCTVGRQYCSKTLQDGDAT